MSPELETEMIGKIHDMITDLTEKVATNGITLQDLVTILKADDSGLCSRVTVLEKKSDEKKKFWTPVIISIVATIPVYISLAFMFFHK